MGSLSPVRAPLHDCEWLGSRYRLSSPLLEDGALVYPEADLWLELPAQIIVASQIIGPHENVSFADGFKAAMREPAMGPARRPARIRVPDEGLAEALRGIAGGDQAIVVGPVPELDLVFAELESSVGAPSPYVPYLAGGAIAPQVVAALFSAAAKLFRAAPWRRVSEDQILRVDIPGFGIDGACLSIIGGVGESFGFLLFRSVELFETFASGMRMSADARSSTGQRLPPAMLSLSFDPKGELLPEMVKEIEEHRWEVAGRKAYPVVMVIDDDTAPLPATERDFRVLTACTLAFLDFFGRHRALFRDDDPEPTRETFNADGVAVTLTAPFSWEEA